ncbi:trypsin-1-like [Schistocerca cancellata]|uniref:trypsin-1-like n=1 Tax=Schistocerca cancellata TaxID=274614 RepID=UPI0021185805|nr:trypsin-1-like [Schistocerca cancellata]
MDYTRELSGEEDDGHQQTGRKRTGEANTGADDGFRKPPKKKVSKQPQQRPDADAVPTSNRYDVIQDGADGVPPPQQQQQQQGPQQQPTHRVSGSLLGTYARPVGLPPDGFDPEDCLNVTVTGWGGRSTSGLQAVNLRKVDISILARRICQDLFAGFNAVRERMVCAGEAGESVCGGDYGGPLVSGAAQLGVASWSASPCEATPAVFTCVGQLRSWVRATAGV